VGGWGGVGSWRCVCLPPPPPPPPCAQHSLCRGCVCRCVRAIVQCACAVRVFAMQCACLQCSAMMAPLAWRLHLLQVVPQSPRQGGWGRGRGGPATHTRCAPRGPSTHTHVPHSQRTRITRPLYHPTPHSHLQQGARGGWDTAGVGAMRGLTVPHLTPHFTSPAVQQSPAGVWLMSLAWPCCLALSPLTGALSSSPVIAVGGLRCDSCPAPCTPSSRRCLYRLDDGRPAREQKLHFFQEG
jgi:hypothetical protein